MSKTISKSFRLEPTQVDWIADTSKRLNTTQTAVIQHCIDAYQNSKGLVEANDILKTSSGQAHANFAKGGEVESDGIGLRELGISSIAGVTGYYISKGIRNYMDVEPDKNADILIGLVLGLGALLVQMQNKE